jgi:hypothetical protein
MTARDPKQQQRRRAGSRSVDDVGRHVQGRRDDVAGHRHRLHGGTGDTDRRRDNATAGKARGRGQDQHHAQQAARSDTVGQGIILPSILVTSE